MDLPLNPALLLNHGAAKTWVIQHKYASISLTLRYSWSAIFLYVYTGQIAFAAISSRSVDLSSKDVQNGHSESEPKPLQDLERLNSSLFPVALTTVQPCSPKSVYFLANKVRLTLLLSGGGTNDRPFCSGRSDRPL
jgi:hypothetical protein